MKEALEAVFWIGLFWVGATVIGILVDIFRYSRRKKAKD